MEKLKEYKAKGSTCSFSNEEEDCEEGVKRHGSSGGGASESEEGYTYCSPPNANGHNIGKVADGCKPVVLAMVPRKLRSAISRIPRQSVSPPLSNSKRKQLHTLNGTQMSNSNNPERFRQKKIDKITKAEEEAAEALAALGAIPVNAKKPKQDKDKGALKGNLNSNSEKKESYAFNLQASKEKTTKVLFPCNGTKPSLFAEESRVVTMKVEPSTFEQPIAAKENTDKVTKSGLSSSFGTSLQYRAGNGGLQEGQAGAPSMQRCDARLWPVCFCSSKYATSGSAPMELDLQYVKKKLENATAQYMNQRAIPGTWNGLAISANGHLTTSSATKHTAHLKPVTGSAKCGTTGNNPSTEMLSSTDKKASCKKCSTHVYITHLIKNYQNAERRQQPLLPVKQPKAKEGTNSSLKTMNTSAGSRNGKVPVLNGLYAEKSSQGGTSQMFHDGRLMQAQMMSNLSATYGKQMQGVEFMSMSPAGESKNSSNGTKTPGQLHVPYPPQHSLMPFPFTRGPYPSHYQDQLSAQASHQVQMHLQHLANTNQMYRPQMSSTKMQQQHQQQQQQIWQAQMAHYRPPLGFPPNWAQQNMQRPESSAQPQVLQQHQFLQSVPPSTSKQMLCNAENLR